MSNSHLLGTGRIEAFLMTVGQRLESPAELVLLGGGGLCLLGNVRPTLDLDFNGEESSADPLRAILDAVAQEQQIDLEPVPLDQFLPLPANAAERHISVGWFQNLHVFVFDPYSIALSKLDRGFASDIEDVAFLLREGYVATAQLRSLITDLAERNSGHDLDPKQMQQHLEIALADLHGTQG